MHGAAAFRARPSDRMRTDATDTLLPVNRKVTGRLRLSASMKTGHCSSGIRF